MYFVIVSCFRNTYKCWCKKWMNCILFRNSLYYEITDSTRLQFEVNSQSPGESDSQMIMATKLLNSLGGRYFWSYCLKKILNSLFPGVESKIDQIRDTCWSVLGHSAKQSFVGILLYGPSGSGKTMIGKCLPAILQVKNVFYINGAEVAHDFRTNNTGNALRDTFDKVNSSDKAVVFIDEVDAICSQAGKSEQ